MTIEQSVIDGIRAHTDMVMLVGQTVALKKHGAVFLGLCPAHAEKTPSFKVDNKRHSYKCFGCGFGGDAIAWVQWRDNIDFPKAVAYLSNGAVQHVNGHVNGHAIAAPAKSKASAEVIVPVPAFIQPPDFFHPSHGKPTTVWTYRNAEGRITNYVARYDPPGDRKVFSPWTYTDKGWAMKGLPAPRPLYGAELLAANPQAEVVVVEGEKCADAARTLLPGHVCVTWHGGAQALKQTDWEPLKGRSTIIWPDADDVGLTAAKQIAKLLKGARIITPPAGVEPGWDAADALAEGWDSARVLALLEPPAAPVEAKGPMPDVAGVPAQDPPDAEPVFDAPEAGAWPFQLLGHKNGVYFYLPNSGGTVITLGGAAHSAAALRMLAPLNFWEASFGCRDNKGWDMVANSLIQAQHRQGIFDATKLRGRGAWWDEDRVVIHLGNRLLVDSQPVPIRELETEFVYEVGAKIRHADVKPLANAEARKLIELCQLISWERSLSAYLLAGWCALAPICGALKWRPHIALSGPASAGKSWIVSKIITPSLGSYALTLASSVSEPGIRRALGFDARPVLVDEFEAKDDFAKKRIEAIMGLMRYSSSETDAMIVKGSNSGAGVEFFKIRSMFCTAAIGSLISDYADKTRISVLGLRLLSGKVGADRFAKIQDKQAETLTEKWVDGLHARIVGMIPVIRKNTDTFSAAGAEVLGTRRLGDQLGTLLAGAFALTSRQEISQSAAEAWLREQDWTEEQEIVLDTDGPLCFARIMEHQIMCEAQTGGSVRRTVGELLGYIADNCGDGVVGYKTALDTCRRHGVLLRDGDMVAISNTHSAIKEILWDSPWAANWHQRLKTIKGAESAKTTLSFGSGAAAKAILVPRTSVSE